VENEGEKENCVGLFWGVCSSSPSKASCWRIEGGGEHAPHLAETRGISNFFFPQVLMFKVIYMRSSLPISRIIS